MSTRAKHLVAMMALVAVSVPPTAQPIPNKPTRPETRVDTQRRIKHDVSRKRRTVEIESDRERSRVAAAQAQQQVTATPDHTHPVPKPAPPHPHELDSESVAPVTTVWDRLAECESGGDWATNTGNGYSGGLQFHPRTWTAHGGSEFAPAAWQAPRVAQIAVAKRVLASQGWKAWPACSRKLGLR